MKHLIVTSALLVVLVTAGCTTVGGRTIEYRRSVEHFPSLTLQKSLSETAAKAIENAFSGDPKAFSFVSGKRLSVSATSFLGLPEHDVSDSMISLVETELASRGAIVIPVAKNGEFMQNLDYRVIIIINQSGFELAKDITNKASASDYMIRGLLVTAGTAVTTLIGGFSTSSNTGALIGGILGLGSGIAWTLVDPVAKSDEWQLRVCVSCQIGILDMSANGNTTALYGEHEDSVRSTPEGAVFLKGDSVP